jgi:hypothetical protein
MIGYEKSWIRAAALLLAAPLAVMAAGAAETLRGVDSLASHGGIREWRADGSRGMWIEASSGHWFYASFSSQCTTLPIAID